MLANVKKNSAAPKPSRIHGGLTPEERDAARRRRIMDAGIEIFGTQGYAGSRINDICKLARVTARNFYDHFASREALLAAVYDEIIAEVRDAWVEAVDGAPMEPVAKFRAGITAFAETMAADERRLRINFVEVVGATPDIEQRRRFAIRMFRELTAARLDELVQEGLIPEGHERLTHSALVGAIQESLVDWVNRTDRPPLDDVIDELVWVFSSVLLTPRLEDGHRS